MTASGRLLLAEHRRHVEELLARGHGGAADRWIALGPSAMAALDERRVPYRIPEDFHGWADLVGACLDLHERLERLCDELDRRVAGEHPDLVRDGIRPFGFRIYPLASAVDSLGSRVFQLRRILDAHPGLVPTIHAGGPRPPGAFGLMFAQDETLWGNALRLLASDDAIETLGEPVRPGERVEDAGLLRRLAGRSVPLATLAVSAARGEVKGGARSLLSRGDSVLLVGGVYDWSPVLPLLRRMGLRPLFAREEQFAARPRRVVDAVPELDALARGELRPLLEIEGVSLWPLLAGRLASIWLDGPVEARAATRRFARVLRRHRVRAVLRASVATGTGHAMNQAAHRAGVPVCIWQHGMVTCRDGISQFRQFADMMTADRVLAYGDEPAHGYEQSASRWPQARVRRIGSASLDTLRPRAPAARAPGAGPRVLYATTNYYGNEWYLGFTPGLSDRFLYRDQLAIVRALEALAAEGRCAVRIKPHPAGAPPWTEALAAVPGLDVCGPGESFTDLLDWSDVVVLDLPSTTLLQALAARKRTFVLLRHWRPSDASEALLRRAAVVADTAATLCAALNEHVRTGAFRPDPDDDGFLRACGTGPGDGQSADRGAAEVADLLARAGAQRHQTLRPPSMTMF